MVKSNTAANVIDLEAFRQRRMRDQVSRGDDATAPSVGGVMPNAMMVPVWVCWVPMWTPVMG